MTRFKYLRRLRPRFSLRALFVLVTLCACAAGWMTYNMQLARKQRLAREQITKLWGYTRFDADPQKLWVPDFLRDLLGDDFFLNVVEVTLQHPTEGRKIRPLTSDELAQAVQAMEHFPRLRKLSLSHTEILDGDLALLTPLSSQIEELYIQEVQAGGPLRGEGIEHLSGWPRLRDLTIHCSFLSDEFLTSVPKLPALERLHVGRGQLSEQAFQSIAACQKLKHLSLFMCSFNSDSLAQLHSSPSMCSLLLHNTSYQPSPARGDDGSVRQGLDFWGDAIFSDHLKGQEWEGIGLLEKWSSRNLPKVKINMFFTS